MFKLVGNYKFMVVHTISSSYEHKNDNKFLLTCIFLITKVKHKTEVIYLQKLKLFVAGSLFLAIFCSAWLMNEKIKREYVESIPIEYKSINLSTEEAPIDLLTNNSLVFERFKPREYVRVVAR
jgi:hypothetical protein